MGEQFSVSPMQIERELDEVWFHRINAYNQAKAKAQEMLERERKRKEQQRSNGNAGNRIIGL